MLYTPLLPEVAAGAIEPRHVVVPLRIMCPHADVVRGRAVALDESARTVAVESDLGRFEVEYERLVVALGAVPRMLPIPGLAEHGLAFKDVSDAILLRNHVLRKLDHADADVGNAGRHLTFVFVGAGYAGVEALAELTELVHDALRHYPRLRGVPQRWALGDCARVPNAATPERPDPPTCQHALRQARRLAKTLRGRSKKPYRYRSLGQGATLGRDKGIAAVVGLRLRGMLGGLVIRVYHLHQLPLASRRMRVLADGMISKFFRRDMADLGSPPPVR